MEETLEGLLSAGTGEIVHPLVIEGMIKFMVKYSFSAFYEAVYNGAWSEFSYAYIHPCDEMRKTEDFKIIQNAFINAYV
jgi:hypothetical protein